MTLTGYHGRSCDHAVNDTGFRLQTNFGGEIFRSSTSVTILQVQILYLLFLFLKGLYQVIVIYYLLGNVE